MMFGCIGLPACMVLVRNSPYDTRTIHDVLLATSSSIPQFGGLLTASRKMHWMMGENRNPDQQVGRNLMRGLKN